MIFDAFAEDASHGREIKQLELLDGTIIVTGKANVTDITIAPVAGQNGWVQWFDVYHSVPDGRTLLWQRISPASISTVVFS